MHEVVAGENLKMEHILSKNGGWLKLIFQKSFTPADHQLGADMRNLTCICNTCEIISISDSVNLLSH